MAQTEVQVLEVHPYHIKVAGQRSGGCNACSQRATCGVQGAEISHKKSFILEVPYIQAEDGPIQEGETLTLGCDEKHLFRAIMTLFGPPLLGLVLLPLLWMACASQPPSDLAVLICAVLGTVVGLGFSRWCAQKLQAKSSVSTPTISVVTNPTKPVSM